MKIVHFITRIEKSGPNQVLQNLSFGQTEIGKSVTVVSLQKAQDDIRYVEKLEACGVTVHRLQTGHLPSLKDIRTIRNLLRKLRCDVAHAHCLRSLVMASLAGAAPLVATSHNIPDEDWVFALGPIKGHLVAKLNYLFLRRTKGVATINNRMQARIEARGIRAVRVNNPVSVPPILCPNRGGPIRRFVTVGHLSARKNPLLILEALQVLGPQAKGIVLDIVGDGPLRMEIEKAAERCSATVNVHGYQSDPTPFFREADAYVSAARSEGMPVSVLEAFSFGLPALLSNISGHEFTDAPRGCIRFFDPTRDALVQAIAAIIGADTPRSNQEILDWVERKFSPIAVARSYQDFYFHLLDDGMPQRGAFFRG